MDATSKNHDTFFSLNLQEMAMDFFLYSLWKGNIYINIPDILRKPEEGRAS